MKKWVINFYEKWGFYPMAGACGDDMPEVSVPPAPPRLKTMQEIFDESEAKARQNYPQAFGARESALADIGRGQDFYKQFQPTSFEQALAEQEFANIWPEMQKEILHTASLSGMEGTPQLSYSMGRAKGDILTNIGEYLANRGQARAQYSLGSRLGIDPFSVSGPYAQTDVSQSNQQAQLDYEYQLAKANADYQNALAKAKQKQMKVSALTTIGGVALGALTGGLGAGLVAGGMTAGDGALLGANIGGVAGGMASPLFGGGASPISFSDALSLAEYPQNIKRQNQWDEFLMDKAPSGTPAPVNAPNSGSSGGFFRQFNQPDMFDMSSNYKWQ